MFFIIFASLLSSFPASFLRLQRLLGILTFPVLSLMWRHWPVHIQSKISSDCWSSWMSSRQKSGQKKVWKLTRQGSPVDNRPSLTWQLHSLKWHIFTFKTYTRYLRDTNQTHSWHLQYICQTQTRNILDPYKTSTRHPPDTSWTPQDIHHTPTRHILNTYKTSTRNKPDTSWKPTRHLPDINQYHLGHLHNIYETPTG